MDEEGSPAVKVREEMAKRANLKNGGYAFAINKTFRWNWDDTIAKLFTKLFRKGE